MCHGFVDDIPGHREFWCHFKTGQYYSSFYRRMKCRYGLLCRLIGWKINIWRLKRVYPNSPLSTIENRLIDLEVWGICESVRGLI